MRLSAIPCEVLSHWVCKLGYWLRRPWYNRRWSRVLAAHLEQFPFDPEDRDRGW